VGNINIIKVTRIGCKQYKIKKENKNVIESRRGYKIRRPTTCSTELSASEISGVKLSVLTVGHSLNFFFLIHNIQGGPKSLFS
jgi:hypothetical protein